MAHLHFIIKRPLAGVATLEINRPERRNAFDLSMVSEMHEALDEIEAEPQVRIIIVLSGHPRVFVAGGDIEAMRNLTLEDGVGFVYAGQGLLRRLERSECVVIAAVGGYALGGGSELALACDFRVASTSAVFGLPETSLGLFPGWGGTQRLARLIGSSRAKDLILTARQVKAEEGYAIGLVNSLCKPEELEKTALDLARAILANAPMAVRRAKRAINEGLQVSLDQGLTIEAEAWLANLSSPDRVEGLSAFLEKRTPRFSGTDEKEP